MRWKWHSPDEIVRKLEAISAEVARGGTIVQAIKGVGISEATYFRWRAQYGSLQADEVKMVKKLEIENGRLRRALNEMDAE